MPIMMIFAVVVIALIVVAGIFAGQQLLSGGNLSTAQTQIGNITAKVQSLYGSEASFAGLTTASAVQAGVFPQNMVTGTTAVNPFGGAVDVADASGTGTGLYGGGGPAFQVQYDGLSQKDCVSLASSVTAVGTYVTADQAGNPMGGGSPMINSTSGQAATPTQAEAACTNTSNSVAFVFNKSSS